jgi:hypothetical protein
MKLLALAAVSFYVGLTALTHRALMSRVSPVAASAYVAQR